MPADTALYLPPIGGQTLYVFGDIRDLANPEVTLTARVHDECNGSDVFGSDILLRNLTSRPVILTYWELMYGARGWRKRNYESIAIPGHDADDTRIDPHSTLKLSFVGDQNFEWGHKALRGRAIYIRLHVAGRRSFVRRVYPELAPWLRQRL